MSYFTGIDVSLRSVSVCIVDDTGVVCRDAKLDAQVDTFVRWLRDFSPELSSVGFEAGALSQYLTYGMQAAGFEVVCLEARQVDLHSKTLLHRPSEGNTTIIIPTIAGLRHEKGMPETKMAFPIPLTHS